MFLGYCSKYHEYKCLYVSGHVYTTKNVVFHEQTFPFVDLNVVSLSQNLLLRIILPWHSSYLVILSFFFCWSGYVILTCFLSRYDTSIHRRDFSSVFPIMYCPQVSTHPTDLPLPCPNHSSGSRTPVQEHHSVASQLGSVSSGFPYTFSYNFFSFYCLLYTTIIYSCSGSGH